MKYGVPLRVKGLANRAFTLVEILVVLLIMCLIASIAIPNFVQARATSRRTACLENLRQIESAKDQFAMANNLQNGATLQWNDIVPTYVRVLPLCPTAGTYSINPVGQNAECSLAKIGHHN